VGEFLLVIDAGHGGKDPGCHGVVAKEKQVALSIALELEKLVKSEMPEVQVIMTRKTDVFVEKVPGTSGGGSPAFVKNCGRSVVGGART
jgi:N-acetylmuramoyl-L-alanine amidase